jgi:hypothetical protein
MNVNHKGPYTAVELVIEAPWLVSDGHGASLKGGQGATPPGVHRHARLRLQHRAQRVAALGGLAVACATAITARRRHFNGWRCTPTAAHGHPITRLCVRG